MDGFWGADLFLGLGVTHTFWAVCENSYAVHLKCVHFVNECFTSIKVYFKKEKFKHVAAE